MSDSSDPQEAGGESNRCSRFPRLRAVRSAGAAVVQHSPTGF